MVTALTFMMPVTLMPPPMPELPAIVLPLMVLVNDMSLKTLQMPPPFP